jgi:hypothetical protein
MIIFFVPIRNVSSTGGLTREEKAERTRIDG